MKIFRVTPKPYLKLRFFATLIDYGIFFTVTWFYIDSIGTKQEDGSTAVHGLPALFMPVFWFLYFVGLEAINQATPGHDIFKLKVYCLDGGKLSFMDAFKRRICDPFDIGFPALICVSKTEKYQRIGDLLANTVVAKKSDITETEVIF